MSTEPTIASRRALRDRLKALRDDVVAHIDHGKAQSALARHLADTLEQLAPERLGLYWSMHSEFNAAAACLANEGLRDVPFALPFVMPLAIPLPIPLPMPSIMPGVMRRMEYRAWNREPPPLIDDCGIAAADGPSVLPDVVLAPCLGFTADGFRLGYGGGFFDRWLAAHPHVTAIGIAWNATRIDAAEFDAQPHDIPMMMILTERGVVAG